MDPDLVMATADRVVVTAGTAVRVPVQVINPADHPVVAVGAVARVPAGMVIPVAVAGDISRVQAQAARAAATCARTAISVMAVTVVRAAVIADSRTQKRRSQERRFFSVSASSYKKAVDHPRSILRQIRQRMPSLPRFFEMRIDHC
jgi:hypothetical protein